MRPAAAAAAAAVGSPGARFGKLRDHLPSAIVAAVVGAGSWVALRRSSQLDFLASRQTWLGVVSGLCFLSAFAYAARKRLGFRRFRRIRNWYIAHIWLTSVGLVVGFFHAGYGPGSPVKGSFGGKVEAALLAGFAVVVASGFVVAEVHRRFTRRMVGIESEHLLPEDIVEKLTAITTETAELMAANSEAVRTLIETGVIAPLSGRGSLHRCLGGRAAAEGLRAEIEASLAPAVKKLKPEEQEVVKRVLAGQIERRKLDVQTLLHRSRTSSLTVHMILSSAVLALLVVHAALVWYY